MKIHWSREAWEDYQRLSILNSRLFKRINELVADIRVNGNSKGIGKPERLIYIKGYWSRRIDKHNRLVYRLDGDILNILECNGHYS